jgi:DNA invertase Pin-like site-specific DNA recombinase
MQTQNTLRVIGYTRVSTGDQADNGHGLEAQTSALIEAAQRRHWELVEIVREEGSGKNLERSELYGALQRIADGEAHALAVAKLDRATRSLIDFAQLLQWFEDAGAALIALDFSLDTSTPTGELMAHIIIAVAQWERKAIGRRTADALRSMRERGLKTNGGNVSDDRELAAWILSMHDEEGLGPVAIANRLNMAGVPTIRGGKLWRQSAIQSILGYKRPRHRREPVALPRLP